MGTLDSRLRTSGMTGGGFLSGMTGDLLLGITEGVLFIWERGVLMTCVMRTMRQPAFFRRMAIIPQALFPLLLQVPLPVMPAGSSLSCPPAPLCHARRLLSVMPAGPSLSCRRPFPVMPAGPSLSCLPALLYHARRPPSVIPAVFSGNPVKTVFLQGSTRESYSFDKASMTAE